MPEPFEPDTLRASLRPLAAAQTPPGMTAYQRYYGLDMSGRHARVHSRLGCFQAAGQPLAVQLWSPPQPAATLLLLHGYYDHMGLYRHVVDWALGMGFAVLACDLPGHGLSGGIRASIDDFADYQAALQGLFAEAEALDLPKPWHLFGQSTGGGILLDYLLNGEPRPELGESILLAPLVRPRAWGWSKLSYRLLGPFVEAIPRRFSENSNDAEFIEFVHKLDPLQPRTLPTAWVGALARWIPRIESAGRSHRSPLVIQGDDDMTVDWPHNLKVVQDKFHDPQLLLVPQAKHHLANETEHTRRRYFAFLSERLGSR